MKAKLFWTCAFAGPMLVTGVATAQERAAADAGDEIIVTAQKREQSLQDVPISMNVLDGDVLSDNNIGNIQQLTRQVPGMVYIESPTIPVLQLRGFASPANNPGADQTVSVYQDGIYGGRARQFQRPFFDVERLEVLRGPQGALLGKNTAAGALSIISKTPTDEFEGGFDTTYLIDREGVDASGFVSGPLSETLSARLALDTTVTNKGWLKNAGNGEDDPRYNIYSGRFTLDYHPSDSFSSVARVEYSDVRYHGTPAANFPGTVRLEDIISYNRNMPGVFGVEDGLKLKPWQASNTATWDFDNGISLVAVTGGAGFDGTSVGGGGANNPEVFGTTLSEHLNQFSQELRLVSPSGGQFEWIAGLYADSAAYKSENVARYRLSAVTNGQGHSYYHESGQTISAYATGTYHATDDLALVAGARYTETEKHGTFAVLQDFGPAFGYVPGITRDQKITNSFFDPSVTLQYDITPDVMVYATWQRGSKGGTFQSTNRTVTPALFALRPERSESYELGVKSELTPWLSVNLAAFQLTFKNLQSSQYIGTPPTLTVVNVGEARSRGLEYTITAQPMEGLSLSAVGSYIDAEYLDYANAPCTFAQLAKGCVNGTINAAGRPLSGVPEFSGTLNLDYTRTLQNNLEFFLSSSVNHETKSNVDANVQNPFFGYKPANALLNGRIGIGSADDRWELALVGRNILDKKTWNSAIAWGPPFIATQTVNVRINEGRSIGVQLNYEF